MRRLARAVLVCVVCAGCGGGASGGGVQPASTSSSTITSPPGAGTVIPVGKGPVGLALDSTGAVWVGQAGDAKVSRIRDGKVDLRVTSLDVPLRVAAGPRAVWATCGPRPVRQ